MTGMVNNQLVMDESTGLPMQLKKIGEVR